MKRENLTRKEAMKAMIDGCQIGHEYFDNGITLQFRFDEKGYALMSSHDSGSGRLYSHTLLEFEDGYYIIDPEPKFKKVVMYSPVVQQWESDIPRASGVLEPSKEYAMRRGGAIGYTEVKVFLKDE